MSQERDGHVVGAIGGGEGRGERVAGGSSAEQIGFSAAEALGQNLDLIIPERLRAAAGGSPDPHARDAQDRAQALRRDELYGVEPPSRLYASTASTKSVTPV